MSKKIQGEHIFGMTTPQMLRLGLVTLVVVGSIFGCFIFLGGTTQQGGLLIPPTNAPAVPPQAGGATPDPNGVIDLSVTATITSGDLLVPPDWKPYSKSLLEVRVPPQFESVDPETHRQERIRFLRGQGADALATQLEGETFEYPFWFNYAQPDTVPVKTSISVKADFLPTETLDEYIDQVYGEGMQGIELVERQEHPIGEEFQAQRILMVLNLQDLSVGVAEYVITDEVNLWIISCWTENDQFFTWLPEFDRVPLSFRLLY
jgi:hypothetical protein